MAHGVSKLDATQFRVVAYLSPITSILETPKRLLNHQIGNSVALNPGFMLTVAGKPHALHPTRACHHLPQRGKHPVAM